MENTEELSQDSWKGADESDGVQDSSSLVLKPFLLSQLFGMIFLTSSTLTTKILQSYV